MFATADDTLSLRRHKRAIKMKAEPQASSRSWWHDCRSISLIKKTLIFAYSFVFSFS